MKKAMKTFGVLLVCLAMVVTFIPIQQTYATVNEDENIDQNYTVETELIDAEWETEDGEVVTETPEVAAETPEVEAVPVEEPQTMAEKDAELMGNSEPEAEDWSDGELVTQSEGVTVADVQTGEMKEALDEMEPTQVTGKKAKISTMSSVNILSSVIGFSREEYSDGAHDYIILKANKTAPASGNAFFIIDDLRGNVYGPQYTQFVKARVDVLENTSAGYGCRWQIVEMPKTTAPGTVWDTASWAAGTCSGGKPESTATPFGGYKGDVKTKPEYWDFSSAKDAYVTSTYKSTRYDRITFYVNGYSARGIRLYYYNPTTYKETFKKLIKFDTSSEGSFTKTGLKPGTRYGITAYGYSIGVDGLEYRYCDGIVHRGTSASFKCGSLRVLKNGTSNVKLKVTIPKTQLSTGYCKIKLYRGSTLIKTLYSNGSSIRYYTSTKKNASKYKYKAKFICQKYPSIKGAVKTTSLCSPSSNYIAFRSGTASSNPSDYCNYAETRLVGWSVKYYAGKVKLKCRLANNRIFKLKKATFGVTVRDYRGKIVGSRTYTVYNVSPDSVSWRTVSMSAKFTPDFTRGASGTIAGKSATWVY